jgi:peroxiredoxin
VALSLEDTAPAFTLPGTDGVEHALASDAPATLVYWTCNHCPYALAWHERMLDVARDYAGRGVRTLAINSNDAERYPADSFEAMAERVSSEGGWPHPFLHDADQSVARAWGAEKTPHLFVLDGELRLRYAGAPDADYDDPAQGAAWVRAALDAVLAGEEPDPAETPAVGCGVKWRS